MKQAYGYRNCFSLFDFQLVGLTNKMPGILACCPPGKNTCIVMKNYKDNLCNE